MPDSMKMLCFGIPIVTDPGMSGVKRRLPGSTKIKLKTE